MKVDEQMNEWQPLFAYSVASLFCWLKWLVYSFRSWRLPASCIWQFHSFCIQQLRCHFVLLISPLLSSNLPSILSSLSYSAVGLLYLLVYFYRNKRQLFVKTDSYQIEAKQCITQTKVAAILSQWHCLCMNHSYLIVDCQTPAYHTLTHSPGTHSITSFT